MKKRIVYTEGPPDLVYGRVVPNFLPPPEAFANAKITVKVTIGLSLDSIEFFKREATRLKVPYQRMIRNLLDTYAAQHGRRNGSRPKRVEKKRAVIAKK